ncbi:MAG: outer membrane channel protein [Methylophilaceae bacterium 17-44-8]|nr:MAG: outer membrane channel protein [Methylophilaceae bacterium 17-44-8]
MSKQKHNQQKKLMTLSLKRSFIGVIGLTHLCMSTHTLAEKKPTKSNIAPVNEMREMIGNGDTCQGQIGSPSTLTLPIGKSTLIKLPESLSRLSIGDPGVLQSKLIAAKTLYLLGMNIGSTNMIIQGKSGACTIMDIIISLDPDALQKTYAELLPDEKNIKVTAAADSIVLSGTVEDAITANRVVDIAQAFVRRQVMPVFTSTDGGNNQMNMQQMQQNQQQGQQSNARNQDFVSPRVVNMLGVSAQQQVMLEVKVAEVSKSLLDRLGAQGALGGDKFKLLTPFFSTPGALFGLAASGPAAFLSSSGTETLIGGTPAVRAQGPIIGRTNGKGIAVDAEKRDGLVKILAEPSIMAISGQEGSFLAGGRIFIPVAQNNNGGGSTITLEEKEFGVGVKFTPTVLAGGRINLKVTPEVSELNREGVGINSTGFGGTAVLPAFSTRKASTTVQLFDGQSFAIGGLIKNNTTANIKAFPILGEIPIFGALFRSTDFQNDKTELIFIVTPHLVKPLNNQKIDLPTDRHTDPTRTDIFLKGKLESSPANNPAVRQNEPNANQPGFDTK